MSPITILVLAMAVGCGLAAPPLKPLTNQTFMATGEAEQHLPEQTVFGNVEIAVDYNNNQAYQRETYEFEEKSDERIIVQVQDKKAGNITYYVRNSVCINETRPSGALPLDFWGWLTYARYEGKITVRHLSYDLWGYNVGGLRLEAIVDEKRTIRFFNRKSAEVSVNYMLTFQTPKFTNTTFAVPKSCTKK